MPDVSRDVLTLSRSYELIAKSLNIGIDAAMKLLDALLKEPKTSAFGDFVHTKANEPTRTPNDQLIARPIHPEIVEPLADIIQRDKLSGIIINMNPEDKSSENMVLYFSNQIKETDKATSEALARSGMVKEIDRSIADHYLPNLADNPMQEIKSMSLHEYEILMNDISKLGYPMNRITLFPEHYESNGEHRVNVGFLSEIPSKTIKPELKGLIKTDTYSIPEIVTGLMVKQQILENRKNYETFMEIRSEYRESLKDNYLNKEKITSDRRSISNLYDRINRLPIGNKEKEELNEQLRKASTSKEDRNILIDKVDRLGIESKDIEYMIGKVNSLHEVSYIVPATIQIIENEPVYELDNDYIRVGSTVIANIDGVDIPFSLNKVNAELDYFSKTNLNEDNRTLLILTENEFRQRQKKKKYRKKELEFTREGNEKISDIYKTVKDLEKGSNSIIQTFNENKDQFKTTLDNDGFVFSQDSSLERLRDVFLDNKFIAELNMDAGTEKDVVDLLDEAFMGVRKYYEIDIAKSQNSIEQKLKEAEEYSRTVPDDYEHSNQEYPEDMDFGKNSDFEATDTIHDYGSVIDRDGDGIDDRFQ